jgi:hypothetical protein
MEPAASLALASFSEEQLREKMHTIVKEEPCFHRGKMDSTRDEEGGVEVRDPGAWRRLVRVFLGCC